MSIKEKLANGLDGLVGFFSPKAGLKRRMFREAIKLSDKFGAYRGAEKNRMRSSWIPGGGSADQDIIPDLPDLRERSRDLNRNDAHASGITNTMTTNALALVSGRRAGSIKRLSGSLKARRISFKRKPSAHGSYGFHTLTLAIAWIFTKSNSWLIGRF